MTPEFATTASALLLDVLELCDRASRGTAGSADRERAGLLAAFAASATAMRGTRAEEWHLASYALAAVADELLIVDIKWPGADWWCLTSASRRSSRWRAFPARAACPAG